MFVRCLKCAGDIYFFWFSGRLGVAGGTVVSLDMWGHGKSKARAPHSGTGRRCVPHSRQVPTASRTLVVRVRLPRENWAGLCSGLRWSLVYTYMGPTSFLKHPRIAAAWCRGKSSPCRLMPIPFGSGQAHAHLAIPSLPRTQRHTQQPPGADSSGSGLFPAPPPAPASSCKIHPAPADVFSAKKIQSF